MLFFQSMRDGLDLITDLIFLYICMAIQTTAHLSHLESLGGTWHSVCPNSNFETPLHNASSESLTSQLFVTHSGSLFMQKYVSSPLCSLQPLSFWEIKGNEYQVKDDGLIKLEHIALACGINV
jgi:hypothetical protein